MVQIFVLLVATAFAGPIKETYRLEVKMNPVTEDYVTIKEVRDAKGPSHFITYRRGQAHMKPVFVSAKKFAEWRKSYQPYLNSARLNKACVHPQTLKETKAGVSKTFYFCPSRKIASLTNKVVKQYRKSASWEK